MAGIEAEEKRKLQRCRTKIKEEEGRETTRQESFKRTMPNGVVDVTLDGYSAFRFFVPLMQCQLLY